MNSEKEMIRALFDSLEANRIEYCVLRNVDDVIIGECHDVDFAVDWSSIDQFKVILKECLERIGWDVFNIKENDVGELLGIHVATSKGKVILMHFDAFKSFNWRGIPLIENKDLLCNRKKKNGVWVCSNEVEYVLKLFSNYLHRGVVREKYRSELTDQVGNLYGQVLPVMCRFLSKETASKILSYVVNEDWIGLETFSDVVRTEIATIYFKNKHHNRTIFRIRRLKYLVNKFFEKNGLMVAFEGCDGSGKSTIINLLTSKMERVFNKEYTAYYHWRPCVLWSKKQNNQIDEITACIPHDKKPYNKVLSFIKYFIFNFDYLIGYWVDVKKKIGQGKMIVFDRYYYDYFIDRYRYRLNISDAILKGFMWMIPKPDLTIVLIGTPSVIYERKKEIPLEEVAVQIKRLEKYATVFHNAKIISVDRTPDEIAEQVSRNIIDCMIERCKR